MRENTSAESTWQRLQRVLRAELALYPGRVSLISRIVLSCTLAMVMIMVFRMPGSALGAYYPLLLSRDSPHSTRRAAMRTSFVCIFGTLAILLSAMLFAASPFLHMLWVAASLFAVFYLISSLSAYDAALALGLIITSNITTWDLPISAGARVEQTLFTLLSILMGCAIAVGVEYVFAHTHPTDAVVDGIRQRLTLVGKLLNAFAEEDPDRFRLQAQVSGLATRGTGGLRERLGHSSYEVRYRERLAAALALSERAVELASNLAELDPRTSAEDRLRCTSISGRIDAITASLAKEEAPGWTDLPDPARTATPLLLEIDRTVDLIGQSLTDENHQAHYHLPEPGAQPSIPSFVEDAFTSKRHLRFAIRGSLSAFACYLVYMSVGWTGLSASVATCVLTALGNTGASRHKQLLRFAGMILGACVVGFGTQALILPQIDSLFAFTILFALVIALGAWVGTSGPRISYAGAQIVLAYDLVNLNRFTITTSLVPARDTVLGILLGIFAMWLIFDHLWAAPSNRLTRSLLVSIVRAIAELGCPDEPLSPALRSRKLLTASERINTQLDQLGSLADFSIFEPYTKRTDESSLAECVNTLQPQLRSFLLVKAGLLEHRLMAAPSPYDALADQVQQRSSAMLNQAANVIESPGSVPLSESPQTIALAESVREALHDAQIANDPALLTQLRLCASILDLAHHIQRDTGCLVRSLGNVDASQRSAAAEKASGVPAAKLKPSG